MKLNEAIQYCMSKKGSIESYPFDDKTLVFKVGIEITNKIFGLIYDRDGEIGLNLKCDPDLALVLRDQYVGVFPGYHMSKKHWNTVLFNSDISDEEIYRFIDISYEIVFNSLSKKIRQEIES